MSVAVIDGHFGRSSAAFDTRLLWLRSRVGATGGTGLSQVTRIFFRALLGTTLIAVALLSVSTESEGAVAIRALTKSHLTSKESWTSDWAGNLFCSMYGVPYMGNSFDGVAACGDQYENAGSNTQGEIGYEGVEFDSVGFQCVELAARYFYAATGVTPPAGNGSAYASDVVQSDPQLSLSPLTDTYQSTLQPGDIVSMGPTSTAGHVGIVTAVDPSVTSTGNGTISILDENAYVTGIDTITVTNGAMTYEGLYDIFQWAYGIPTPNFSGSPPPVTPPTTPVSVGSWNRAIEPAGSQSINGGGNGQLVSVSCPSNGDCSAGGFDWATNTTPGALIVDEVNGAWQTAFNVSGFPAESGAVINSISCSSPGNCAAGGFYSSRGTRGQAFVVNEVDGTWENAIEVPGTAALNTSTYAMVNAISCSSSGNCAAGGFYSFSLYGTQAFVVNEVNGVWGNASSLYATSIDTISCASPGNCSAGGDIETGREEPDGSPQMEPSVASEVNGNWGPASDPPGSTALNAGGYGEVNSISCASAGNCSLVGQYENAHRVNAVSDGQFESFTASEVNGKWSNVEEAPNSAVLNVGGAADLNSISCSSPGNCSAGGYYQATAKDREAFVINEVSGKWHDALEVPRIGPLNSYGDAMVNSVSCASVGHCSAGGYYYSSSGTREAFIVNESGGTWDNAEEVPGISTLNLNWAEVDAVACSSGGYCSAVGKYDTKSRGYQVFTANN